MSVTYPDFHPDFRILVCGGRNFNDRRSMFAILDTLRPTAVIQGGANGADALALDWAHRRGTRCHTEYADWDHYGKATGSIRNALMIRIYRPHLVVAFPGGRGTNNMIEQSLKAKIPVMTI